MSEPKSPKARRPDGRRPGQDPDRLCVLNRQRRICVDRTRLVAAVEGILSNLGLAESELTVSLVSDTGIRSLNRRYLGREHPTDVLAFSQREGLPVFADSPVLGDVVISVETAARQARENEIPFNQELDLLLVHGILHLLGYDHTRSLSEAHRMSRKQGQILRRLHRDLPP